MLFANMLLKPLFAAEDPSAVFTSIPMLFLLVRQAELSVVGRPSSEAPAAFNLVCMRVAVVEVLAKSLRFESPATAFMHDGRGPKMKISIECDRFRNCKVILKDETCSFPVKARLKRLHSAIKALAVTRLRYSLRS